MRTLVEYGLANAAAATALAVVVALVGLLYPRPAVRNALWVLVLVRLIVPSVWTVPLPVPSHDLSRPEAVPPVPEVATPSPGPESEFGINVFAAADFLPTPQAEHPVGQPVGMPANEVPSARPESAAVGGAGSLSWDGLYLGVGCVWLAGSAIVAMRAARSIRRFRRGLRDARPAPADVQQQVFSLAGRLGLRQAPEVFFVPGRVWPFLWVPGCRVGGAKLIFPVGLWMQLDPGQRAAVLAHELAHLRRGDWWVRWLEVVVCVLYWWHPLLGWFRRRLRAAEEECCDLWVVAVLDGRRAYATALVEAAAFVSGPESSPMPITASGAGPVQNLQRRVTMIMRATWPASLTRLGLAAVLGLGGLGLVFGPVLAQERKDRPEQRPGKEEERPKGRPGKDRPDGPPAERGDREAIERARMELEKARVEAQEAMERLRAAAERLARAEGRPIPPGGFGGFGRPDGEGGRPPFPPDRRPGVEGGRPGPEGGPPVRNDMREMQQQIEELRRMVDQLRREMRGGREGRPDGDRPGPREGRPDAERPREGRPDAERPREGRPDGERPGPREGRPDAERPGREGQPPPRRPGADAR